MFRRPVFVGGKACDFLEQTGEVLRIRCGNFGRYIYYRFDCSAASVRVRDGYVIHLYCLCEKYWSPIILVGFFAMTVSGPDVMYNL